MPVEMERALRRAARKQGLTGERADAYVYGTMRKSGWKPAGEGKGKGSGRGKGGKR